MKSNLKTRKRKKKLTTVLGLALDSGKLEGVVLRRANGALQKLQTFSAALTLDPLTAAPELVSREIRNHLDAAGVRERDCVVGLPLKWVLTAQTELPKLSDADAASLLQMEAEKGFHADATTLQIDDSRCALEGGKSQVLLAAIPTAHVTTIEQILAGAKLKPASLALGVSALQAAGDEKADGVMALAIGETSVALQITIGGGIAALRSLPGAVEAGGNRRVLQADVIAREARVTLGQLPAELRGRVKRVRIFGPRELAQQLADEMELRFEAMGFKVELVSTYAPDAFGATLPAEVLVSPAFSLAAGALTGIPPVFEFLPPKPTLVEQLVAKYSSGQMRTTGAVAAGVGLVVVVLFLYQQVQLIQLGGQWSKMSKQVADLQGIQDQIQEFKPWAPGTYRNLAILRVLSQAFPQDGVVTARVVSIREDGTVNCSGNTQDNAALVAMQTSLSAQRGVSDVHIEQSRGNKSPIQFVFSFKFNPGAAQ